jgi:hypothetical protein
MKPKRLKPGHIVQVSTLPTCDYCLASGYRPPRKARYDFRARDGRWGNGCVEHYRLHRMVPRLGIGAGQMLITPDETLTDPTPPTGCIPRLTLGAVLLHKASLM